MTLNLRAVFLPRKPVDRLSAKLGTDIGNTILAKMNSPPAYRFRDDDEGVPAFDRREFVDAFHYAYKAVYFGGPQFPDPHKMGFDRENEDGTVEHVSFADNATNRVGLAISRRYRDCPEKGYVFLIRFLAMVAVWRDRRIAEWRHLHDDGREDVHPALMHAAAITDLQEGEFDLDEYFENVARLASEDGGLLPSDPEAP